MTAVATEERRSGMENQSWPRSPRLSLTRNAWFVLALGVVASSIGLVFSRAAPETYDSQIMLQVTQGMASGRGLTTTHDIFGFNTPYSSYGIGMSLLMLVPYVTAQHLGGDPVAAAMDVNGLLLGATCATLAGTALLLGASRRLAGLVAVAAVAGTPLLAYTSTAFSEPGVGFGIALGILGLSAMLVGRRFGPLAVGLGAGIALLMRTDSVVLVVPILLLAAVVLTVRGRRWRQLWNCALPLAVAVGILAAYNSVRFGSPLRGGYRGQPFDHPILNGLRGLLVSPGRGLLWYSPLAVVALLALLLSPRSERVLAAAAAALLLVRLAFYARWWAWNGGWNWGPRFLVPAMPALMLGMLFLLRRWDGWGRVRKGSLILLTTVSIAVSLVGAAVAYEASPLTQQSLTHFDWSGGAVSHSQTSQAGVSAALDDWSRFPVTDEASMLVRGQSLAGRSFNDGEAGLARDGTLLVIALLAGLASAVMARPTAEGRTSRGRDPVAVPGS